MRYVKLDPPGTLCTYAALRDMVARTKPVSFIDIGCGAGNFSKFLCSIGLRGAGIDFSPLALETSKVTLRDEIVAGRFALIEGDATNLDAQTVPRADIGVSVMVMEHVENDTEFVRRISMFVQPGGYLAICVPGRRDCWSFEDETVGHLRRYDRDDLYRVLNAGGLLDVEVWSVAVPVANILLRLGSWLIRNSDEAQKVQLSQREQTEASGVRDIRWKTVFPQWCRVLLNQYTLSPLFLIQRLFYASDLGVTMLGFGRVPYRDREHLQRAT
jgi:2-polyprenyl-3-methyl-5-hydroxy-6-metoxy-1,4-benzoquinol methylase